MAHTLKNDAARATLKKKLQVAFNAADLVYGYFYTGSELFDSACTEAMKSVAKWMSMDDVREMIAITFRNIAPISLSELGSASPQRMTDAVNEEMRNQIIDTIINDLAQIPRTYTISFPIRQVRGADFIVTDQIKVVAPKNKKQFGAPQEFSTIDIVCAGYVSTQRRQSAMREAYGILKVSIKVGRLYGIFSRALERKVISYWDGFTRSEGQMLDSASVAFAEGEPSRQEITLGASLSKFLERIVLSSFRIDNIGKKYERFSQIMEMLYKQEFNDNVVSIRRSLEWAFDADVDEDETTSFVKTCIGLEAALAEQSEEIGITAQLADRCAFLLHSTAIERGHTRKLIREIYALRSKIVHGNINGLSHADFELAGKASDILSQILKTEINAVLSWSEGVDNSQE